MKKRANRFQQILWRKHVGLSSFIILFTVFHFFSFSLTAETTKPDYCVDCHRNRDFIVTQKKLYLYYQNWTLSRHKQEEVACSDCHGGNPKAKNKHQAHGKAVGSEKTQSWVDFRKIPDTCGKCHNDIYEGYQQSQHFKHLIKRKQEEQGPSCVTCHGAMKIAALHVTTVQKVCPLCHNPETNLHPQVPDKAESLLNGFLAIHRFYRFVSIRGKTQETRLFLTEIDDLISSLSVDWHTFDLEKIEQKTKLILTLLKKKRDQIRQGNP